jgi:hypothetical protein
MHRPGEGCGRFSTIAADCRMWRKANARAHFLRQIGFNILAENA